MARATSAVTAGPGVIAATAIVVATARKMPGVTGCVVGYSQPLRRK
jgi:hypothetical protein